MQEYSLQELADTTTSERIVWEESLKSAQSAAFFERMKESLEENDADKYDDLQTSHFNPAPANKEKRRRYAGYYR